MNQSQQSQQQQQQQQQPFKRPSLKRDTILSNISKDSDYLDQKDDIEYQEQLRQKKISELQQDKIFDVEQYLQENPIFLKLNVSQKEIMELKQAFDFFDTDGEGTLDRQELRKGFAELGFGAKDSLETLLETIDHDGNQQIDFTEFVLLMTKQISSSDTPQDMTKVFKQFDLDEKNSININDLRNIALEIGENVEDSVLQEMINQAASDGANVTLNEFISIIQEGTTLFDQNRILREQEKERKKEKKKTQKK